MDGKTPAEPHPTPVMPSCEVQKGLTGPVPRGDVERIRIHLAALPPKLVPLYRELTRQALAISPALPAQTRAAIAKLLR